MAERVSNQKLALVVASDVYGSADLLRPDSNETRGTLTGWDIESVCAELLDYREAVRAWAAAKDAAQVALMADSNSAYPLAYEAVDAAIAALLALVQADQVGKDGGA